MTLYLVRHGYAGNGYPDEERELTSDGISILRRSAALWKHYISNLEFVISSPLLRAVQTAEIISNELNYGSKLFRDNLLAPGSGNGDLPSVVNPLEAESVMIVGHMPDLGNYVSSILSESLIAVQFKPGTIASVKFKSQVEFSRGILKFVIPPLI